MTDQQPMAADRMEVEKCDICDNIHFNLLDKDGNVFATASVDPSTAAMILEDLRVSVAEAQEDGGLDAMACKGHA